MDLRALALSAVVMTPAMVCAGEPPAFALADTVVEDGTADDAFQDDAEFVLESEMLALLDALLLDPVELGAGDVDRLGVLPWLDEASLAALATAPRPHDLAGLARLPDWDVALARRVAPFIRFAPAPDRIPARVVVTGSTTALRGRVEARHARFALRYADAVEPAWRGFVQVHHDGWTLAAGDLRYGHAQGLLAWTGETSARAGATIARRARGLVGSESASRLRTARGVGLEVRVGGMELAYLFGEADETPTRLAACRRQITPTSDIAVALLHERDHRWWSGGVRLGPTTRRLAFEVAGRHHPAVAVSGEARTERLRLGVRFDTVPPGELPSLAGATASVRERGARMARAAARYTARAFTFDVGVAGERRGEGEARARWRTETSIAVRAHHKDDGIEFRFDDRVTQTDTWLDEAASQVTIDSRRVVVVRFDRRLVSGWKWTAEMRTALESQPAPARDGRSWSLRFERTRGAWRPVLVGGAFRTDPGVSVGTLGAAVGLGPVRLQGDGMQLTAGLRWAPPHWTAACGAVTRWTANAPPATAGRVSLSIRFP